MPSGNFWFDYQNVLVGLVGFAGVIITLIVNAQLANREAREQRRHNLDAVRVAILEELRALAKAMATRTEPLDVEDEEAPIAFSMEPMDRVYLSHLDRIGLLSNQQIEKVLFAYGCYEHYERRVAEIAARYPQPQTVPGREVVQIPRSGEKFMQALAKGVLEPVEVAIKSLEETAP